MSSGSTNSSLSSSSSIVVAQEQCVHSGLQRSRSARVGARPLQFQSGRRHRTVPRRPHRRGGPVRRAPERLESVPSATSQFPASTATWAPPRMLTTNCATGPPDRRPNAAATNQRTKRASAVRPAAMTESTFRHPRWRFPDTDLVNRFVRWFVAAAVVGALCTWARVSRGLRRDAQRLLPLCVGLAACARGPHPDQLRPALRQVALPAAAAGRRHAAVGRPLELPVRPRRSDLTRSSTAAQALRGPGPHGRHHDDPSRPWSRSASPTGSRP